MEDATKNTRPKCNGHTKCKNTVCMNCP